VDLVHDRGSRRARRHHALEDVPAAMVAVVATRPEDDRPCFFILVYCGFRQGNDEGIVLPLTEAGTKMGSLKKSKRPSDEQPSVFRALAILIPLTAIAFCPVLVAGYIRLDDHANILENPNLQRFSLSGLARIWTQSELGFYNPITYSLWWIYGNFARFFGTIEQAAPLFHALNLAIHIVNASLVFVLLQTLLHQGRAKPTALGESRVRRVSLMAALFFALHPVQVETVAWVSELKGGLAGMLGLLGIWQYYRSPRKTRTAMLFMAAMLAKPSAIIFPGILLLMDRILLGKSMKESIKGPVFLWLALLPLVLVTKYLQPDSNMEFIPSLSGRLQVATDALSFYVFKVLYPLHLALDYGRSPRFVLDGVPGWQLALSMLLAVAGLTAVVHALVRPKQSDQDGVSTWRSFVLCGLAVFCLAIAPVLGLVPFAFQDYTTVADHYLYIPMVGASLVVVGVLIRIGATVRASWIAAAILVVLVLGSSSFSQATTWRSTETVFRRTLEINPRSFLAHYSLATELLAAGRTDAGIEEIRQCLAINPNYLSAEVALGTAWIRKGEFQNAIDYYLSVLARNPSTVGKRASFIASIHNNLGMALHQVGRNSEGTEHFRKAVDVDPGSVNGHTNLGRAAFNEGRLLDAVAHYQRALELSPGNPEIMRLLEKARGRGR
jgi:protein O-mannosyl-transferase